MCCGKENHTERRVRKYHFRSLLRTVSNSVNPGGREGVRIQRE